MREYFEAEMRALQEAAQEFAEAYPDQAKMLNLNTVRDRDPYVERLLEGMAFLSAQMRQRMDERVPEISQALLDQVCPSLYRPYPSTTIVEFFPSDFHSDVVTVAAGEKVGAFNVGPERAEIQYATRQLVKVQPLRIDDFTAEERNGVSVLRLTLGKHNGASWADMQLSTLPIYLNGDWPLVLALRHALLSAESCQEAGINGQALEVVDHYAEGRDGLLPNYGRSQTALSLIHDYFCARGRFMFVALKGLDCQRIAPDTNQISIEIVTPVKLPADHRVSKRSVALHCTPAVNLIKDSAVPLVVDGSKDEYTIKVDGSKSSYSSVYRVEGVTGRDLHTGEVREYSPLFAKRVRKANDPTYEERHRAVAPSKRRALVALDRGGRMGQESISTDILITNDQYPRQYLDVHGIAKAGPDVPRDIKVRNITRPSQSLTTPQHHDIRWQLVSLLNLSLNQLSDVNNLKHLLSLFDWTQSHDNSNRIDALLDIQAEPVSQFRRGVLSHGVNVTIKLEETGFSSMADAHLFASVMHKFFCGFVSVTEFVKTTAVVMPSYETWHWQSQDGTKPVL
ncbi:type VI secretion system baseplate subunit TssF [Salinibius halmophilus]|uniref:type VI secretion system baseplate subunit TssF n=1 Tax=Salinibius halmophilus TaxID=1853216 RepID=UPI000E66C00A|nr:type VI secretion system baseplate subunit TssF [Salinibius halmophilus]